MKRFQTYINGEPSYLITVEPLTQELYDRWIRYRIAADIPTVEEYKRHPGLGPNAEIALAHQNGHTQYYHADRPGYVPPANGLITVVPLD